jgi:hypothetical protein
MQEILFLIVLIQSFLNFILIFRTYDTYHYSFQKLIDYNSQITMKVLDKLDYIEENDDEESDDEESEHEESDDEESDDEESDDEESENEESKHEESDNKNTETSKVNK